MYGIMFANSAPNHPGPGSKKLVLHAFLEIPNHRAEEWAQVRSRSKLSAKFEELVHLLDSGMDPFLDREMWGFPHFPVGSPHKTKGQLPGMGHLSIQNILGALLLV